MAFSGDGEEGELDAFVACDVDLRLGGGGVWLNGFLEVRVRVGLVCGLGCGVV